ncbi:MAG: hypothetical protein H0X03_08090 [Nitrosopumilus sp.]|nr:hypothetical protein [Nitrosopumilus sp.]
MNEEIKKLEKIILKAENNFYSKFNVSRKEDVEEIREHIKDVMLIKNKNLIPFEETPNNIHEILTIKDYKDMMCNYHQKNEVGVARIIHDNKRYPQWRNLLFVPQDLTEEDETYVYTKNGWKRVSYIWVLNRKLEAEYLKCCNVMTHPDNMIAIMIYDYKNNSK